MYLQELAEVGLSCTLAIPAMVLILAACWAVGKVCDRGGGRDLEN